MAACLFPYRNEAALHRIRQRRTENKATRLRTDNLGKRNIPDFVSHLIDSRLKRVRILQNGGDVDEVNTLFGKIGDMT